MKQLFLLVIAISIFSFGMIASFKRSNHESFNMRIVNSTTNKSLLTDSFSTDKNNYRITDNRSNPINNVKYNNKNNEISNLQETQTPTPTQKFEFPATPTPQIKTIELTRPRIEAFIRVPTGLVPKPYVILSGYQTITGDLSIVSLSGDVDGKKFFCPISPCALELSETGLINFHAQNGKGEASDEVQANILVTKLVDGFSVTLTSLGKFVIFSDACANIWQSSSSNSSSWARFPQDPAELNTEKSLYYLSERILKAGIVTTTDCPGGGWDSNGAPNACGMSRVKEQMINWQNQYDMNIWLVSRDVQVPPIILKTLLEIESQFWPISQRLFLDEIGLGQINQLGIDVLLRTNPSIYQQVCSSALYNCDRPYISLSGIERALIRGALAQSLDATCASCPYGFNINKSAQSIPLIAKVLYSNCVQAKAILNLNRVTANYEDSWKFTMVSYHSGFGCLQDAIAKSAIAGTQLTWQSVLPNLKCQGATGYVDRFWSSLQSFDNYRKIQNNLTTVQLINPTPMPVPTIAYSKSRILVKIFMDKNGDGIQQSNESLDNVQVNLDLENGVSYSQISKNGLAIFNLSNIAVGVKGKISLPGLYRNASFLVQAAGDTPIIFVFSSPILPTRLP
ncbi:MAG: hypothetical protein WCK35_11615 [Chloroflexota bacterium]